MRAPPLAVAFSILGAAASAQPANETAENMEACFQSARAADAICSDPANDAAWRLECLAKARTAQLECLDKVLPSSSAGLAAPETPAAASAPDPPTGTVPDPAPGPAVTADKPAAEPATEPVTAPVTEAVPDKRSEISPEALPADPVSPPSAAPVEAPVARRSTWVVSETTSPLDYSPLIIAVVRATAAEDNAPVSLTIRCRAQRADVLIGTQGAWRASPGGEVQVEYQIGEQTAVRQPWLASPDGKTARFPDDAVAWLRTLPDDGRLKVGVFDGPGPSHETTFPLDGLDAVRKKVELACKSTAAGDAAPARGDRGEFRRGRADDGGDRENGRHRRKSADDTAANRTYRTAPASRSR